MEKKEQLKKEDNLQEKDQVEVKVNDSDLESDGVVELKQKHKEEVSVLNDKLLRLGAEIENLRRRNEQQTSELKKYAVADFAKDIIGVLENFYLIIDNAPSEQILESETFSNFFKGIEMTHSDLTKVFEKNGITRIYPLDEKFDHNMHQAIKQVDSEKESGVVVQVLQAGYMLNDRLLKEAMVVISK